MINSDIKHDAEKNILQHMIANKLYISIADSKLDIDFFSKDFKSLYNFLISYYHINNDTISNPNMLEMMYSNTTYKTLDSNTIATFMSLYNSIDNTVLSESSLNTYIDILKNQYVSQQIYGIAEYIANNDNSNISDANKDMLAYISSIMSKLETSNSNVRESGSIFESANNQLHEYQYIHDHPKYIGIKILNY